MAVFCSRNDQAEAKKIWKKGMRVWSSPGFGRGLTSGLKAIDRT
jgi:hypothetical protein